MTGFSNSCTVLTYLALYADSTYNSSSASAEETRIPLDDKITFLQYVVLPSFYEAEKKGQTREMYIQERVQKYFKDKNKIDMLLPLSSSITDKDEANKKLAKAEEENAEEMRYQLELARGWCHWLHVLLDATSMSLFW